MQIIGFNYTKISGEKKEAPGEVGINAQIKFTDVQKEKVNFPTEEETLRLSFTFSIEYEEPKTKKIGAEIRHEGFIVIAVPKPLAKEFQKAWKKKELPKTAVLPLYNFIWKGCSLKALQLEEELNLPPHIPLPKFSAKQ